MLVSYPTPGRLGALGSAFAMAALSLSTWVLPQGALLAQPGYTANERVDPYQGRFLPGMNLDYLPPYDNFALGELAAGDASGGIRGVGARSTRPGLQDKVLGVYGYDISLDDFDYFGQLGMTELTAIVGFPADDNRDWANRYCGEGGKWNALFKGIYEPIWDGGANGTPYGDDNLFAKYMYEVVTRYKDDVRFWEIWNEPGLYKGNDSQVFWGNPDYPGSWWVNDPDPCDYSIHAPIEHFVRTLRIAYEVIKTVAPDDYVVLAGVGSQSFLDAVLRNTDEPTQGIATPEFPRFGGAYFDVLGFHTYPHLDGSVFFPATGFAERHSDGAADGVIDRRLAGYQQVLYDRGYDGVTYPRKEHIATEINVPRLTFSPDNFGGNAEQVNFMPKAFIQLKVNRVHQMHVYSISDKRAPWEIGFEFDAMGMYEHLPTAGLGNARVNDAGKSYKTVSDLLTDSDYDPTRTAQLRAPAGVRAYAFAHDDGTYVYALWAETTEDLSEYARADYAFPADLVDAGATLTRYEWDYGYTDASSQVAPGTQIRLTERPIYLRGGTAGGGGGNTCAVTARVGEALCDDRGNDSGADDLFTVNVAVTNADPDARQFRVRNGATTTGPFDYGAVYVARELPAAAARVNPIELTLIDVDDPTCTTTLRLSPPGTCGEDTGGGGSGGGSGGNNGVDLELALTADKASAGAYDYVTFTLTLTNAGAAEATGVRVDFPKPSDYPYTTAQVPRGEYSDWTGVWEVGSVAAGETLELAVTRFTLTADERTAWAQVASSDQADVDSEAGNAMIGAATEDDEAVFVVNDAGGSGGSGGGGGGSGGGGTGGGGGGGGGPAAGVDLELSMTSSETTFRQYAAVPLVIELTNAGTETATDVVVDAPFPDQFVHTSSDASRGRFSAWLQRWTVGAIGAGETVRLDLQIFPLTDQGPAIAFAQVAQQGGPSDADSSPGNALGLNATEDDEARLEFGVATLQTPGGGVTQRAALTVDRVYADPVGDRHYVEFTTRLGARTEAFVADALGRAVLRVPLSAPADGTHRVSFDTHALTSGLYRFTYVVAGRAESFPLVVTR